MYIGRTAAAVLAMASAAKDNAVKIWILVVTFVVLAGCSGHDTVRDKPGSAQPDIDSSLAEPAAVRASFIKRLRRLAKEGNLFDPDSMAPILQMSLQTTTRPGMPQQPCGDGTHRGGTVRVVTSTEPSWFRTLPSGIGYMPIPAYTINPATTTGDPKIAYEIIHAISCRDFPRLQDHTQASLYFSGLPAFACFTPSNIRAEAPEARYEIWTDGVSEMILGGRVEDDSAVSVSFFFRAGAPCAVGASVKQDQEDGLRYLRAKYKFELCRRPSDEEFCAANPLTTWGDRESMRRMVMQVYNRCGTTHSFYVKEPATGEVPPPLPERKIGGSPCDLPPAVEPDHSLSRE